MPVQKKKTSINLLIKEKPQENLSGQFLNWALTYGRYIIIIIQIIVLSVFFMRFKLDRDHADLKEAVSQKQALVQSLSDLENEINRVQKRISDISLIFTDQDTFVKILTFLEMNTPSDTVFSVISYDQQTLKVVATASNLRSFNYLLRKLQDNNLFADISLEDLQRRADGKVVFKVRAKVNISGFN